jgi:hypothetical protein
MEKFPEFSGSEYEEQFVAALEVHWDAHSYLSAREQEESEHRPFGSYTDPIIREWFQTQADSGLPSFESWKKLTPSGKRQVILDWVATHQPESHHVPGENLHHLVAEELGLNDNESAELLLCSAAHSPADTLYGIDGFLKFRGQVVTFDLTANPDKTNSGVRFDKADELISCSPSDGECLRQAAQGIAHEFKSRLERAQADQKAAGHGPTDKDWEERQHRLAEAKPPRRI